MLQVFFFLPDLLALEAIQDIKNCTVITYNKGNNFRFLKARFFRQDGDRRDSRLDKNARKF